jgi:hypothetical protein
MKCNCFGHFFADLALVWLGGSLLFLPRFSDPSSNRGMHEARSLRQRRMTAANKLQFSFLNFNLMASNIHSLTLIAVRSSTESALATRVRYTSPTENRRPREDQTQKVRPEPYRTDAGVPGQ